MAWAPSPAICSSIPTPPPKITINTPTKLRTPFYISSPSKLANRKNYLRKKLAKTLRKPYPPTKTLETPQEHLDESVDSNLGEIPSNLVDEFEEMDEDRRQNLHHSVQSASFSVPDGLGFGSYKLVFDLALYFVGLFVAQTVIAVWFFRSVDYEEKSGIDGSQSISESETVKDRKIGDGLLNTRSGFFGNVFGSKAGSGEVLTLDESEWEEKISEIRVMAREARACEKKPLGDLEDSEEVVFEDTDSRVKTEIQEQVDRRLRNLKKNPQPHNEKSPQLLISSLNISNKILGGRDLVKLNEKGESGKLESKKRRKFKSVSAKPRNNPKEFNGSMNYNVPTENEKIDTNGDSSIESKSNGDISDSPAAEEDESYWLRDDILKDIVSKIRINKEGGVEPFSGLNSKENLNFFQALERKFEREGESAKRWMETKIENIDLDSGDVQQINQESALEGSEEPYVNKEARARERIGDVTNKFVDGKDIFHPSSKDSPNVDELLLSSTKDLHASTETQISEGESSANITGIEYDSNFLKNFQDGDSSDESSTTSRSKSGSKISEPNHGGSESSPLETKSREFETQISRSLATENQDTSMSSVKQIPLSSAGNSKPALQTRGVESKLLSNKVGDSWSDIGKKLWWRNLPYVLAILLRRGSDLKGSKGLYSLKTSPLSDKEDCLSYTIAFEDRGDATNFCYLLESFFEDLGDFSADVVPLSQKELNEGQLIVVRKGQLRLYAGQPLAEVEMALRSFFNKTQKNDDVAED